MPIGQYFQHAVGDLKLEAVSRRYTTRVTAGPVRYYANTHAELDPARHHVACPLPRPSRYCWAEAGKATGAVRGVLRAIVRTLRIATDRGAAKRCLMFALSAPRPIGRLIGGALPAA